MAKGEAKRTNQLMDDERARNRRQSDEDRSYYTERRNNTTGQDDELRKQILSGYGNLSNYGQDGSSFTSGGGGGGGGYAVPNYSLDKSLVDLEKRYGNLSGGLDSAYKRYGDLADTGGYSSEDINNIRARGTSTVPQFYDNLRNEMNRKAGMSGLSGTGFTAALNDRMDRNQARMAQDASLSTELGLGQAVREGRLQGLGGLERLGQFGYGGLRDIAGERQSINERNASAAASASNARANDAAEEKRYADRMRLAGLGGLQEMYGSSPAETARYENLLMGERGLSGGQAQDNIALRAQYNPNRSGWDKFKDIMGMAGGVAGMFGA